MELVLLGICLWICWFYFIFIYPQYQKFTWFDCFLFEGYFSLVFLWSILIPDLVKCLAHSQVYFVFIHFGFYAFYFVWNESHFFGGLCPLVTLRRGMEKYFRYVSCFIQLFLPCDMKIPSKVFGIGFNFPQNHLKCSCFHLALFLMTE